MKITATTSKGTHEYLIAESWEQLSTDAYQRIIQEWDRKDLIKLFSILSGIEYGAIASSNSEELEEHLIVATSFVFEEKPKFKDLPMPATIRIRDTVIIIPTELGRLPIAQNIHVRQRLAQVYAKLGSYDELISFAVAIYLQPLVDGGDFDFKKALELEDLVKKLPIVTTYSLGFFLLSQRRSFGLIIMQGLRRIRALLMKSARGSHRAPASKNLTFLMT